MNLSARIKNSKTRPNYILNVNINIPLRPNNMEPYRPVSGQFTFSPSHRNKKLKLQIPSARTTNECESRKISYLGQTQNTISYRNQGNRKKTTKSAFPTEQISKMFNNSNQLAKSKNQFRSEAVSPNGKKLSTSKKMKISSMNHIVKGKQLVQDLLTESEDNIIGYTNQSSELERMSKDRSRRVNEGFQLQDKDRINIKNIKFKSQSPLLEQQKGLIYGIRQFQKSAQLKKQHLNYEYLKQKVLVLASVKKIQRAWRNYKTKKLIKSYSNNISLKFTGKLKNQQISNKDSQQNKILTVRSCGFSGQYNDFKKQIKKNLSQLYPKQQQEEGQGQEREQQQEIQIKGNWQQQNKKKICQVYSARDNSRKSEDKDKQFDGKSAVVKFQMEEIRRWEELINNIRQGKKVDQVLEKSFRRKQELEKQLSDNLKQMENLEIGHSQKDADQIDMHDNQDIASSNIQKVSQKMQQTFNNVPTNFDTKHHKVISIPSVPSVSSQISVSSQQQNQIKLAEENSPSILSMQKKQLPIDADKSCFEQSEEGATTQRRRQKLQYFQNQLRKIDNQYSESNLSKSHNSESELVTLSPEQIHLKHFNRESEEEENNKLKRKIQAMARIKMFEQNQQDHEIEDQQRKQKQKNTYLYTSLQRVPDNKKTKKVEKNKDQQQSQQNDFFPLTVSRNTDIKDEVINKDVETDRLQTFRKKASQEISHHIIYEDLENLRLKNLKKKKFTWAQKEELSFKIEEEVFYDLLLQFSEKEKFISKMETLYVRNSQQIKKQQQIEKPEGICTNLQSIKDYLQNFVAFAFEQQPTKLLQGFNSPKGPNTQSLLKMLNRNRDNDHKIYRVLSDELFDHHWDYASEQIYFDVKYPNDAVKEQQRVKYLKSITKMYFKAIFDGFNQCLESYRVYGLQGKCYPWQLNLSKKNIILNIQQIKPLIRMGYRKLSQIAIIYCGLLFEDKKHNMSLKMIEQIQKQRLDTLVEIELQDEQYKWNTIRIERASTIYNTSNKIWQALVAEACEQILRMNFFK